MANDPIQDGDIVITSQKYGDAYRGEPFKAEHRYEDLDHHSGFYWQCEGDRGHISIPEVLLRKVTTPGAVEAWQAWHDGQSRFLRIIHDFNKRPPEEEIEALQKALDTELIRMEADFAENKLRTIEYYMEQIEELKAAIHV